MPADGWTLPQPRGLSYQSNRRGIGNDKSVRIYVGPHNSAIQGRSHWTPITSKCHESIWQPFRRRQPPSRARTCGDIAFVARLYERPLPGARISTADVGGMGRLLWFE